ncbi:MAG: carbon monoxide dehydrogenase subunit G [Anaerolineae bacterium]
MKLAGEFVFDGPREQVWDLVRDPEVLATALPGTQSMNQISESEYEGKMHVRVGPISGVFAGRVVVSDEVPPESYTLSVEGRGAAGFGKGSGQVALVALDDGKTLMQYAGELQIGGKLAGVGQRMVETVAKSMTRQGLESLNRALQARAAPEAEAEEMLVYQAPSEVEFATGVAKDLLAEFMSPEHETERLILTVALIAFLFGFLLGRGSR